MTDDQRETIARQLAAHGNRAVLSEDWTPQFALDVLRENRRRYAGTPKNLLLSDWSRRLVNEVAEQCDLAPRDLVRTLLALSGLLGAVAIMQRIPAVAITDLLGYLADDLDQQTRAGEQA